MTTPYDRIWALDHDLAKYPPGQRGAVANRRLIMRKHLKAATDEAFEQGYTEGMRDAHDDARADQELAQEGNADA
jgi:hypothetical protein